MKKVIGILGVAVIAATMFFSANNVAGSNSDVSLSDIIAMSKANAEGSATVPCKDLESGSGYFAIRQCGGCKWVNTYFIFTPNTCTLSY